MASHCILIGHRVLKTDISLRFRKTFEDPLSEMMQVKQTRCLKEYIVIGSKNKEKKGLLNKK